MAESEDRPEPRADVRPDGKAAAAARMAQQQTWVDLQVRQAMDRGDFDNLPGAGKPIPDLGDSHDPNWWIKKLIERENVALLPPSVALRKEDAELDARLDEVTAESEVRREVEDFNKRVIETRRQLQGGPPVITAPRDVDDEVAAWRERRTARVEAQRAAVAASRAAPRRSSWWSRWRSR